MGLPVVAPLAKLIGLIGGGGGGHIHGLAPLLMAALLGPFGLKFSFSFRPLREGFRDMVQALRLFWFQMSQGGGATGSLRRRRALRLVYDRLVHVSLSQSEEDSLFALSLHTL